MIVYTPKTFVDFITWNPSYLCRFFILDETWISPFSWPAEPDPLQPWRIATEITENC